MFSAPANRKNFFATLTGGETARFLSVVKCPMAALLCLLSLLCIQLPVLAKAAENRPVYVYAAASMQVVLTEVLALAGDELSLEIVPVYGGSAGLARQIAQGAPAALFLSANNGWVQYLSDTYPERISEQQPLLRNSLAFVASPCMRDWHGHAAVLPEPEPEPASAQGLHEAIVAALQTGEKIALGMPDSVPAGSYTRQSLQALGLWDAVMRQAVYAENVTVALNWVARCDVAFGFVYESDVLAGQKLGVRHVSGIPGELHQPIIYPMAYINGPRNDDARRLGAFLKSAQASEIFLSHGFALAN